MKKILMGLVLSMLMGCPANVAPADAASDGGCRGAVCEGDICGNGLVCAAVMPGSVCCLNECLPPDACPACIGAWSETDTRRDAFTASDAGCFAR